MDGPYTHPFEAQGSTDSAPTLVDKALRLPRRRQATKAALTTTAIATPHCERVRKLNNEIRALYRQLARLQQHEPTDARSNWKRRSIGERLARDLAEYENESLKQRMAKSVKLGRELKSLLLQQASLSRKVVKVQYSLPDDDTRVFGMLRADICRRQHQLETFMQTRLGEITRQSFRERALQPQDKWAVVVQGQGLRTDVEDCNLMPFNADQVNAAIDKYTLTGSIQVDGDNVRLCTRGSTMKASTLTLLCAYPFRSWTEWSGAPSTTTRRCALRWTGAAEPESWKAARSHGAFAVSTEPCSCGNLCPVGRTSTRGRRKPSP